ncbi:hypothetical protein EAE96_005278 [Botrytis aclada]|nr:hypothetical protein EAE96_005278 [Botrytis aclada]
MILDTIAQYSEFFCYFVGLTTGWLFCSMFGYNFYAKGESRMRAALLLQLLKKSPEERYDRILDLFFFVLSDKKAKVPEEFLPEILEHLERRISATETVQRSEWFLTMTTAECERYCDIQLRVNPDRQRYVPLAIKQSWDIPTLERPMGFEKEIVRVQRRIEEYKKGIPSSRAEMVNRGLRDWHIVNKLR